REPGVRRGGRGGPRAGAPVRHQRGALLRLRGPLRRLRCAAGRGVPPGPDHELGRDRRRGAGRSEPVSTPATRLRADARRNVEGIRTAALDVFRERGLNSPLEEVARAAGVSKGTIYHRFGGRQGLIEAVVEELVAERIRGIGTAAGEIADPVERFEHYRSEE